MAILEKIKELMPWRKKDEGSQALATTIEESAWPFDPLWQSPIDALWSVPRGWWPDLRAEDDGEQMIVRANVPGLDPNDVNVTMSRRPARDPVRAEPGAEARRARRAAVGRVCANRDAPVGVGHRGRHRAMPVWRPDGPHPLRARVQTETLPDSDHRITGAVGTERR